MVILFLFFFFSFLINCPVLIDNLNNNCLLKVINFRLNKFHSPCVSLRTFRRPLWSLSHRHRFFGPSSCLKISVFDVSMPLTLSITPSSIRPYALSLCHLLETCQRLQWEQSDIIYLCIMWFLQYLKREMTVHMFSRSVVSTVL